MTPSDAWLPEWLAELPWEFAGRLLVAAVLGGAIGLEREYKDHPAGFRTNILVAVGACLFTILSIIGFPLQGTAQDTARIAAQIVSGIGFLGAGALFRDQDRIRGVTTAATIWVVAAIGMAAGTGHYFLAFISTVLAVVVLVLLQPISERIPPPKQRHDDVDEGDG